MIWHTAEAVTDAIDRMVIATAQLSKKRNFRREVCSLIAVVRTWTACLRAVWYTIGEGDAS